MSQLVWSYNQLVRSTKSEDPEVRYWAIDRLIRHFPAECPSAIAPFLLDEHDATPSVVAGHLGAHGNARHHAILVRGFRLLRGVIPGHCLQALTRLGYPGVVDLAASALKRGDLNEPALAFIVEALADQGTPAARELIRRYISRKIELLAEPATMRGVLRVVDTAEIPTVLSRFLTALQWRGSHRAGEVFRTLMDTLKIDDASWCFRTGPGGHIELRKTIKAVESGYDCDIDSAIGKRTINQVAQRLRAGDLGDTVRAIAEWTEQASRHFPREDGDDLPERIVAAVSAFKRKDVLADVERLGHQVQQWLLGFQLSAAFAVARAQNFDLALKRARGQLDRLLDLAAEETSFLVAELPSAIALVCREAPDKARQAEEWCLRMLEAQGPFFPKVIALETLGELGAVHFIPEVMDYLADENSYVYGAAERALSRMGEAIVAPAVARIESGDLDPDAAHSILVILCDLGTGAAYEAVMQHLDWFMDAVGPGTAAEWVSLFGTEELIDPLREWLDQDPAMVGQGLLLLGAIHNVQIPEEEEILQAIEEARARQGGEPEDEDGPPGPEQDGGSYVM
jgi:HEAT repeat protein